jgi:hypothetical protein
MQEYNESEVHIHTIQEYKENDPQGMDTMANVKMSDRGYDFVFRFKENASGKIKRTKVDVYTTEASNGSTIRNAESGHYYNHRVGSSNEYLYFKVAMSTGELKPRNSSNILFYDSPGQYEQHLNGVVSDEVKSSWAERRDDYVRSRRSSSQSS